MMTLIVGGSGSGKSAFAEQYVMELSGRAAGNRIFYLATMQVFDREGEKKVERHRMLRNGKGFMTVEQPVRIEEACEKMGAVRENMEISALLECMSNLTANEMFSKTGMRKREDVVESILSGIRVLKERLKYLVIVSNNVFEDGCSYDESTMEYIRALGEINIRLAAMADEVIEVVSGIPVVIKKGR